MDLKKEDYDSIDVSSCPPTMHPPLEVIQKTAPSGHPYPIYLQTWVKALPFKERIRQVSLFHEQCRRRLWEMESASFRNAPWKSITIESESNDPEPPKSIFEPETSEPKNPATYRSQFGREIKCKNYADLWAPTYNKNNELRTPTEPKSETKTDVNNFGVPLEASGGKTMGQEDFSEIVQEPKETSSRRPIRKQPKRNGAVLKQARCPLCAGCFNQAEIEIHASSCQGPSKKKSQTQNSGKGTTTRTLYSPLAMTCSRCDKHFLLESERMLHMKECPPMD